MKIILKFDTKNTLCLPQAFQNEDVRFSDSFAEYFIQHFSKPEDVVFDPFAGFGTTLYIAERLGRRAFGVEYLPERTGYIKTHLQFKNNILCGSAFKIIEPSFPMVDFVLTSPPFMQKTNHLEYPFAGYKVTGQDYKDYLNEITNIFILIRKRLRAGAYVIIEASNLCIDGNFTPLAWDIAENVGKVLVFIQEIIIDWQNEKSPAYGFGYDHSYALIFQNK